MMENVLCSSHDIIDKGISWLNVLNAEKKSATPKKTWKMAGRADKAGKKTELTIGLFEHCGKSFRSTLGKKKI